jgi:hypothetical protein
MADAVSWGLRACNGSRDPLESISTELVGHALLHAVALDDITRLHVIR